MIARGSDRPGAFTVEMQVDLETQLVSMSFRFSATSEHYPHDLLPALGFMQSAVPPNSIQALVGPERVPLGEPVPPPNVASLDEGYVHLVQDLARLQRETGTYFTMPSQFSPKDLREIAEGLELLDGKEVELDWRKASFELNVSEPARFLDALSDNDEGMAIFTDGQGEVTVAGHTLPLGKMRTHSPAVRITNLPEVRSALGRPRADDEDLLVRLDIEALDVGSFRMKLLPE
jgi:hypothetical protein